MRIYDVCLMSSVNVLSLRVTLPPEFTPLGKPTGELIAVEHLLAQSNRGDLPGLLEGVQEDESPDVTILHSYSFPVFFSG
ncbi:hypothetical protein JOB18_024464 [Solea senegalensis]|uniref:Uncharacterized protein n=1 Tax=Solea senegalensis TaxID=28829 RepID=A0AAV6T815_SOLSE|nr:hypothetical protein JOB18_024464 [Solea senegalensis]